MSDIGYIDTSGNDGVNELLTGVRDKARTDVRDRIMAVGLSPVYTLAGAVDTIGQSVGLLDDDTMVQGLSAINDDLGRVYEKNRSGFRMAGDIATMFGGAGLASKAIRSGGMLAGALDKMGKAGQYAKAVIISDVDDVARMADKVGKIRWVDGAVGVRKESDLARKWRVGARVKQAKNDLKEGVATEMFIAAFQNESELFFPEGQSFKDYALMTTAGLGIGGAIGQAVLTPALKRAASRAGDAAASSEAIATGQLGPDLVIGMLNAEKARSAGAQKQAAGRPDMLGALQDIRTEGELQAKQAALALGQQSPIEGLTVKLDVTPSQAEYVTQVMARAQPGLVNNTISLEAPGVSQRLATHRSKIEERLDKELKEATDTAVKMDRDGLAGTGEYRQVREKQRQLIEQRNLFDNDLMGVEVSAIGTVTSDFNRRPVVFDSLYETNAVKVKRPAQQGGSVSGDTEAFFSVTKGTGEKPRSGLTMQGELIGENHLNKRIETLDVAGVRASDPARISRFYASMPRALRALEKAVDDEELVTTLRPREVTAKASHVELDFAIAAVDRKGFDKVAPALKLGSFVSADDMRFASLDQKYQWFANRRGQELRNSRLKKFTAEDFTHALNLRMTDDYGLHGPAMEWFEDMYANGAKSLRDAGATRYNDALTQFQKHFIAGAPAQAITSVYGAGKLSAMRPMLEMDIVTRLEKPIDPFSMLVRKGSTYGDRNAADHALVAREIETTRQQRLRGLVSRAQNPAAESVMQVIDEQRALVDEVINGIERAAPGSESLMLRESLGQLGVTTKNFRGRGVQGMSAASALSDMVQRRVGRWLADDFTTGTKAVAVLRNPANAPSAHLYGLYETAMQKGWVLADDAVPQDGLFKLDADAFQNKKIAEAQGFSEVPEYLPHPLFKEGERNAGPLQLDAKALAALKEIRRYDQMIYATNTAMLRSMGKGPNIVYRRGHTVVPARYGQEMAFVTDETGHVVEYALGASTSEAMRKAKQLAEKRGPRYGVVGRDSVEAYKDLRDQVWNSHTIDVSDSFAKNTGVQGEKREIAVIDGADYLKQQLEQIRADFNRMSTRMLEHTFMPQMEQLRYMQRVVKQSKLGLNQRKAGDDVFDLFKQVLTNESASNEGSFYGSLNEWAEHHSNQVLTGMREVAGYAGLGDGRSIPAAQRKAISEKLAKDYGFDPVGYADRLAKVEIGGSQEFTSAKKIVTQASYITQVLALKMFEAGHGILTMASMATTLPDSIQWFRGIKGETLEARKARLGWMSDVVGDGVAVPSPTKLLMETVHDMFRDADMKRAIAEGKKLGYVDAPVGEFFELINGASDGWAKKNFDKFMKLSGWISTKSEEFSRAFSFAVGYNLSRRAGKNGHNISMAFANSFANRVIADYRPNQRAQVFQGFLGTPLALFQTFSINYFQKLFSAVENKAYRTLLTQYGTQAFVFGGEAVPGYDLFNEVILGNYDGTERPSTLLARNEDIGAVLQFGTLSNLPKLFGADGIALHVRGEMQTPKNLTPMHLGETPAVQMLSRSLGLIRDGVGSLMSQGDVGGFDAMQEALVLAMPNRPLRGAMELMQGYATNANGDIVEDETRTTMSVVSRLLGMRPLNEAQKAKTLWEDRQADLAQRERVARLSKAVIANIRDDGKVDADELAVIFERYVAAGGSEKGFKRWFKNQAVKATQEKFTREMIRELKRNPRSAEALRFMRVTGPGIDEGAEQ